MSGLDIAVIGAGVVGLSSALRLAQEFPDARVTVFADNFDYHTTSAGAAGLWEPYKLSDTPFNLILRWGEETYHFLQNLLHSEDASVAGIIQTTGVQLWTERHADPIWKNIVPHFHRLSADELAPYNEAGKLVDGWTFTTLICEGSLHLKWLRSRLEATGAVIRHKRISDLSQYDLVINCSGLGAFDLFKDKTMYPIQGHVIRVSAPWIKQIYFTDEETYVIPNKDTVVLGGTGKVNVWERDPSKADRESILRRCKAMLPSLEHVIREWVGLRPGRPSVRLELAQESIEGTKKTIPVVHNYGHGGSGLTLAWGCAGHVLEIVKEWQTRQSTQRSRL